MQCRKHALFAENFWYLDNYPLESGRVFFVRKVWFARTLWVFSRDIWVRSHLVIHKIPLNVEGLTNCAIIIYKYPQNAKRWGGIAVGQYGGTIYQETLPRDMNKWCLRGLLLYTHDRYFPFFLGLCSAFKVDFPSFITMIKCYKMPL